MPCCYILHSQTLNRYYIGATGESIEQRLEQHLSKFFGTAVYTAKANDWTVALDIPCSSLEHALRVERFIKRMKRAVFIRKLMHDNALVLDIVDKTLPGKPPSTE
jgi:putative endonuclease